MNLDQAKHHWQKMAAELPTDWPSEHVKLGWHHPALRRMRLQLIWEGSCYVAFAVLFYTGLDGDTRPLGWNVALAAGLLLLIGHAVAGYRLATRPIGDGSVRDSLTEQVRAIRTFGWMSIFLRTLTLLILVGFLTAHLQGKWYAERPWTLAGLVSFTGLTVYAQYRLWRGRLRKLEATLRQLDR